MWRLLCILLFIGGGRLCAQDLQYSQFFANQLDLNPAFAGSQQYHRIIMNYRNQWPEMGNPYVTYSFSFDTHLYKWNSGVGVRIEQDRQGAGALKTLTVSGMYSYLVKIRPEDAGLRFAVGASMIQNSLDMSKLEFPDMIDPIYGSIYPHNPADDPQKYKKVTCDFSAGVLGFFGPYHFGASVQHIGEPSLAFGSDAHLPMKYTVHAGMEIGVRSGIMFGLHWPVKLTINPLLMYQKQSVHQQMNYGAYCTYGDFIAGAWYRQNFDRPLSAMLFMVGYDTKYFRVAYSFDWTISKQETVGNGAHEVSFMFLFWNSTKKKYKAIPCPSFYGKNGYS